MDIGVGLAVGISVGTFILAISGVLYTIISSKNTASAGIVGALNIRIGALESELKGVVNQRDRLITENEDYRREVLSLTRELLKRSVLGDRS